MSQLIPLDEQTFSSIPARKLSDETCAKWKYGQGAYQGKPCQIANLFNPTGTKIVAQKIRMPGKEFRVLGDLDQAGLYGQHLWRDGGKKVVVTEGEIDALSVSEQQQNKWPVVSIPNGASAAKKFIQPQLEWLERFDEVILMFDQDDPGRDAAAECAELFTPGKCKLATLPLKDANDMLKAGRGNEIIDAIWGAKAYRPDGIVSGEDLWDQIVDVKSDKSVPYGFSGLDKILLGIRKREIVTLTAGSGVGKSALSHEVMFNMLGLPADEKIGIIALEESNRRTALRYIGLDLNVPLHISREGVEQDAIQASFKKTVGSGRMFFYDHWGSTDSENLFAKIRYLARGSGCSTILLDHLSIVVSGIADGDERRVIDNTMTKLRSLVEELDIRMILVSHLKRPEGTPHEEGGKTSLAQLRGSAAIGQLSDIVIGCERNQQHPLLSNYTHLRILKNRYTGETGSAGWLLYDRETGRLKDTQPPLDDGEQDTAAVDAF